MTFTKDNVIVIFDYSESCKNVYKTFKVYINDKKSNVVGLRKYLTNKERLPDICTKNTYFFHSLSSANQRRNREKNIKSEVCRYFESENFVVTE